MASTPLDVPFGPPAGERSLYSWAAIVALVFVFAGFAPTYFLKGVLGAPELSTLKHVHGIVMTAWFTLFLIQVRLVATGNVRMHRKVGTAGIALAILVLAVGMQTGIASARAGVTPLPSIPPLVFLVMPVAELAIFAVLIGAGIAMRKRAAYHKRFMLLASLAILTPAMARLPFEFVRVGGPPAFFALTDLVILACIAFDTVKNRRVHPAFIIGLIVVVAGQLGRLAVAGTPQWMAFARWLVS
jgi:uncharacterized membrane protein YozB (DUF420 family)